MNGPESQRPKTSFIEATRESPPTASLMRAVELVSQFDTALDLGAGGLSDSRFLRTKFSDVVALDRDPAAATEAARMPDAHLHAVTDTIEDFAFPRDTYDLVNAQNALPFVLKESLAAVCEKVYQSLKSGGIFVGNFFGMHHGWRTHPPVGLPTVQFQSTESICAFLRPMEIIELSEEERDARSAVGTPVHWHNISFIARKP